MHIWLRRHPFVVPPIEKEIEFFDRYYKHGSTWYRAHFPTRRETKADAASGQRCMTGEATPDYLMNPLAPARVAATVPRVKLVAFLRDPADRAFSYYNHRRRRGTETLSFGDAIQLEEEQLSLAADPLMPNADDESRIYLDRSYLRGGLYAEQLARWWAHFPREQLLIIRSEDLFTNPSPVFHQVLDFLELPHIWEPDWYRKHNVGEYTPMDDATRRRLVDYFRPHNQKLEEILGRALGWGD